MIFHGKQVPADGNQPRPYQTLFSARRRRQFLAPRSRIEESSRMKRQSHRSSHSQRSCFIHLKEDAHCRKTCLTLGVLPLLANTIKSFISLAYISAIMALLKERHSIGHILICSFPGHNTPSRRANLCRVDRRYSPSRFLGSMAIRHFAGRIGETGR